MHNLDWLFAIGVIFFCLSVWGIGANVSLNTETHLDRCDISTSTEPVLTFFFFPLQDIANSYATSVSSQTLTLIQAGVLATITEFIGAIALGQQVTATIRSGVFSVTPFEKSPGALILAMVCAEVGTLTLSRLFWLR